MRIISQIMGGFLNDLKINLVQLFVASISLIVFTECRDTKSTAVSESAKKYTSQNFNNYSAIWNNANDSIQYWIDASIAISKPFFFGTIWSLDSVMLINHDSTRLYSALNCSNVHWENSSMDDIRHFAGAKINGKWYFFLLGRTLALPREQYKYNKYEPMTLEQISYLAHKEILSRGIKRLSDGRYVTDESFMERTFFDQDYIDREFGGDKLNLDTMIQNEIAKKYNYKIAPEEISRIKRSMAESKRPYLPPQSWWDRTFNRKIFDE